MKKLIFFAIWMLLASSVWGFDLGSKNLNYCTGGEPTDLQYLQWVAATSCYQGATPSSAGDVTSAGDCALGACYDGTSDGGTYVRLFDGGTHYGQISIPTLSANSTYTFPSATATICGTDSVCSGYQASITNPVTGTGTQYYWPYWSSSSALGAYQMTASRIVCSDSNGAPVACSLPSGYLWQGNGSDVPTAVNSLNITSFDMTSQTSSIPWIVSATTPSTWTTDGLAWYETDTSILHIRDQTNTRTLDFYPKVLSDTLYAPVFVSGIQNYFWATPNGSSGVPSLRAMVAADVPTLNQDTTGTAAGLSAQYIDWSASSGGTSIANKPSLGTLSALAAGTMTDTKYCIYTSSGNQIVCNSSGGGGITDIVQDTTPQLGGSLDVNGNSIVSVSNGNINIIPNGTGNVGINTTTPVTKLQVVDTITTSPRGIMSSQYNNGTDGARLHMRKGRGTLESPTVITTGDNLGRLVASGYDGTNYLEDVSIIFGTEGTIATTKIPTNIQFYTATNAAPSVLTEAMRIDSSQRVGIGTSSPTSLLNVAGTLGTNSVVNGTFDSDTSWTKGTGWTIAGGVAVATATTGNLNETASTVVAGKYYKLVFDAVITSGTVRALAGGWTGDTLSTTASGITRYFYAVSTAAVTFDGVTSFTGTIDNVVLTEVQSSIAFDNSFLTTSDDTQPLTIKKVLNNATGDQAAMHLVYETNKAAGNDTGLLIDMLDTNSPGTSYPLEVRIGGSSLFNVAINGRVFGSGGGLFGGTVYTSAIASYTANSTLTLQNYGHTSAHNAVEMATGTISNTSGQFNGVVIMPIYNQTSGTAANTDLLTNRTETAVGSGVQYLRAHQVGGNLAEALTSKGHIIIDDAITNSYPTLSSCGTSPTLSAGSNDYAGMFTIGATGTGCVVTFGTAYTNTPSCIVQAETVSNLTSYTLSNSAITIVGLPGNFHYICIGLNGGV